MSALHASNTAHRTMINSRRVVEDAIDQSKISGRRTWGELIANDDAGRYPVPPCAKEEPDDLKQE